MELQAKLLFLWEYKNVTIHLPVEDRPKRKITLTVVASNVNDAWATAMYLAELKGRVSKVGTLKVIDIAVIYKYLGNGAPIIDNSFKQGAYDYFFASREIIKIVETGGEEFDKHMAYIKKML